MEKNTKTSVSTHRGPIVVTDQNAAPVVYFDIAPSFSVIYGVVGITLAMARQLQNGDDTESDFIVTGHIRCSARSAADLRNAIDKALLLLSVPGERSS